MTVLRRSRVVRAAALAACWTAAAVVDCQHDALGQIGPDPKQEFRGAWIATVANLDWPNGQGYTAAEQQAQLVRMLDRLKDAGINAVMFQVRDEADAFYDSPYEPWSVFLTGEQGRDPGYDPLAFAVREAHRRGMELHAWFNPYRVWSSRRNYPRDPSSPYLARPEWLLTVKDTVTILDPGIPAVRAYLVEVISDVVRRYDVDGVHFDDYFYPYEGITNEDVPAYQAYGSAFTTIDAWRRNNVDLLVRGVYEAIESLRPEVKFGISPFGIWKSGTPPGVAGLSGATELYADAAGWMQQRWLDYLTPQLYWAFGGGQDYGKLAPWWATQVNGRHLYPGLGLYRADPATASGTPFSSSEIPNQIRLNRRTQGIGGQVLFRAKNVTDYRSGGIADTLGTDLYLYGAMTPTMPWKDVLPPAVPRDFAATAQVAGEVTLSWGRGAADAFTAPTRFFAVYRVQMSSPPDWVAATNDPSNLVVVTGDTIFTDHSSVAPVPYRYVVTALSSNSVESLPTEEIVVEGGLTAREPDGPATFTVAPAYPNPFRASTRIAYRLESATTLAVDVIDLTGRKVESLAARPSADGRVVWTPPPGTAPGTYFIVFRIGGRTAARPVVLVR